MAVKRFFSYILVFTFILGMASASASTAGSADDPLITKSYIDNTYPSLVLKDPVDYLANSMSVLKYKLSQASLVSKKGVYTLSALPNGTISLTNGASFVLLTGSATVTSLNGTLIDVTNGTLLTTGSSMVMRHRYVAAENTKAVATVGLFANLAIYGDVTVTDTNAPTFSDVSADQWYFNDVCYAVKKGLVNGRSTSLYAPEDNLSIAEAIKLAASMHQLYQNGSVTLTNYSDSSIWYKTYVDYASQNKITTKIYQNYNAKITRSEFVSIFYAALPISEYAVINTVSMNAIPDVKSDDSSSTQIYTFYRSGILTGSDAIGTFYPNNNIKRSEVAAILTRMFEKTARKSIMLS